MGPLIDHASIATREQASVDGAQGRAAVIVNPQAGRGGAEEFARRAAQVLAGRGMAVEVLCTTAPGHAVTIARGLAAQTDLVVAVGGDGTASEVANGLMGHQDRPVMAIVPAGSACDLALNLGVGSAEEGLAVLSNPSTRPMDVGRVDLMGPSGPTSRYFVLTTGTGYSPWVIRCATPRLKRVFGSRSYMVSGVLGAMRHRPPRMRWSADGEEGEGRVFNIVVANGEMEAGGARMSPGASLFDGRLWVGIWHGSSSLAGLWRMRLIYSGTHVGRPFITYRSAQSVSLESYPPVGVQVDGEVPGTTPARFTIVPGALRVIVGPGMAQG